MTTSKKSWKKSDKLSLSLSAYQKWKTVPNQEEMRKNEFSKRKKFEYHWKWFIIFLSEKKFKIWVSRGKFWF